MKIVFMGTPDFARDSLEELYNANYDIAGVVTVPDKAKGRGMKLIYSEVKEYALEKNLKIYQPEKLKNNTKFLEELKKVNPDVICVVAYGKILPKEILELPKYGCINVHPSLLPKYRGSAPVQWAVLNGDKETGVTTMCLDQEMDAGDILLQEKTEIGEDETTGELWDRLSKIGAKLLVQTLEKIEDGTIKRIPQNGDISIAPMLSKEQAKIDWNLKTANEIKNLVRGLNPIMGAYSNLNGKKIKFWKVQVLSDDKNLSGSLKEEIKENLNEIDENRDLNEIDKKNVEPGTVIMSDSKKGLYIKAKNGVISVLEIQGENAKRMPICDFLRGNKIDIGEKFTFGDSPQM